MNLTEIIHQRWAAASALNDLLPVSRVTTGIGADATLPYAVIAKRSDRPMTRHHDGSSIDVVRVRISVFDDNHDSAAAVTEQIKTAFDRTTFDLSGSDRVLDMQRSNDYQRQDDDAVWEFVIDFDCTVYVA